MKLPKPRISRKAAAAASIAVIVGATIATRSGSALQNPATSAVSDSVTLEEEFSQFVHGAIEKNAQSKDFGEWESSGFTGADIIANAAARRDSKQAFAALCRVLGTIDDESLAMFQNEIASPQVQAELSCARELSARMEAYWNSRRAALESESTALHMNQILSDRDEDMPTLPTEEIPIDTSKGEYIRGELREGYIKENQIAITIDDGPHPTITRKVLNTLKAYGVRANFFSCGQPARMWPELDKAEIEEGHITGSHTISHPNLPTLPVARAEKEILGGRKIVEAAAGVDIPFFRFPYGSKSNVLLAFTKQQGLTSFFWNMDSEDWKRHDPSNLFHHQVAELDRAKGGIILMHDIHEQTAIALPHLLDEIRHRGWSTVVFVPH